jgi:hypothetical protein
MKSILAICFLAGFAVSAGVRLRSAPTSDPSAFDTRELGTKSSPKRGEALSLRDFEADAVAPLTLALPAQTVDIRGHAP